MQIEKKINSLLKDYSSGKKEISYEKLNKIFLKNKLNNKLRYNIAVIEQDLNLNDKARENYTYLIKSEQNTKAMINLYLLEMKEEKFLEALKIIEMFLKIDINNKNVLIDKAFIYYKLNSFDKSITISKQILKSDNKDLRAFNLLGLCYSARENFFQAEEIFKKGLSLNPNFLPILNSIGMLYHEQRKSQNAERYFLKALSLDPDSYHLINNIAGFYLEECKYLDAINYYKKALSKNPNNPSILNNLGKAYFSINKIEEAEKTCLLAKQLNDNDSDIFKTLSQIYFKKNELDKAWKFFDGRLGLSDFIIKNASINRIKDKIFRGNIISTNSKILILREQGVGDEILYGTMYKDLLNEFDDVQIECDPRLIEIFKQSFDKKHHKKFFKLGTYSNQNSKLKDFDIVMYAGSLGRFYRNKINNFSTESYLNTEIQSVKKYKTKLKEFKNKINIGISWKSFNNRYSGEKSLSLDDFSDIFATPNCNFINLQYGDINDELEFFCKKRNVKIITLKNLDLFNDLIGVSGLLKNLDLFISVSNSTAHIAGAMGVKTILIKPFNHATYHYWNHEGSKTPWYNSVTMIEKNEITNKKNFLSNFISI